MTTVPSQPRPALIRAIGRWTLTALVINAIIGSGIFGLPDDVARSLGAAAPFGYLLAALGIGVVMACFAEVAARFTEAGGPYLYARVAFGRFTGVQVGWFTWLTRLTAAAANANLFVDYLGGFWPGATDKVMRALLLSGLLGLLAVVNVRGVRSGARVSNYFTIAKLVPIAIFIGVGLALVGKHVSVGAGSAPSSEWLRQVLALMFVFGGFEAALIPLGEAKEPRRDAPFALFTALGVVTVVYLCVHLVVMGAFTDPAMLERTEVMKRPVAEAARVFLGDGGALLIAIGVLLSTYGYLAGAFVSGPRLTFAFAQQRDFPSWFTAVHPRFHTPHVSILVHMVLVCAFAILWNFNWNAILSATARLATYAVVCAAVIRLRYLQPDTPGFRVPGGWLLPMLGLGFCVVLAAQMGLEHALIAGAIVLAATINWYFARRQKPVVAAP